MPEFVVTVRDVLTVQSSDKSAVIVVTPPGTTVQLDVGGNGPLPTKPVGLYNVVATAQNRKFTLTVRKTGKTVYKRTLTQHAFSYTVTI